MEKVTIVNDDVSPKPVVDTISEEAFQIGCGVLMAIVVLVGGYLFFWSLP
jgi:hypothetical protein